jgi:hypothetical protein
MTEKLLQFIWQHQYFNTQDLYTLDNEPVKILHPGKLNHHQGPDFSNARIQIGDTIWVGQVELHLFSSHWNVHKHAADPNYQNVILHVVWKTDCTLLINFPEIVLQHRIPGIMLQQYVDWMNTGNAIPCAASLHLVPEIIWKAWEERMMVERLEARYNNLLDTLQRNQFNWEEAFWWRLAHLFGGTVNATAFEVMAQSIPFNLLAKHKHQYHQIEALLFGQAGLLERNFSEKYPQMLQKEYRFLQKKYTLTASTLPIQLLRMRPQGFPTVRLAQLAMLMHLQLNVFASILKIESLEALGNLLSVTANDYWNDHFLLDERTVFQQKKIGKQMVHKIIINAVVPFLFAYGKFYQKESIKEKAIAWILQLPPEQNKITELYQTANISCASAASTQAILTLHQTYCMHKRCLDCAIGNSILKRTIAIGK